MHQFSRRGNGGKSGVGGTTFRGGRRFRNIAPSLSNTFELIDYRKFITIEPGKRGGRPCVRGMRITVGDVLGWLAAGMSPAAIVDDFPELAEDDIRACLSYAADRERRMTDLGGPGAAGR